MGRRRDHREMEALLARRERRGLTWSELSEASGVPRSTLALWHRRLRSERGQRKDRSGFVRVSVVDADRLALAQRLEIVLRSGHRVLVPSDVAVDDLRRVIEVLESGC